MIDREAHPIKHYEQIVDILGDIIDFEINRPMSVGAYQNLVEALMDITGHYNASAILSPLGGVPIVEYTTTPVGPVLCNVLTRLKIIVGKKAVTAITKSIIAVSVDIDPPELDTATAYVKPAEDIVERVMASPIYTIAVLINAYPSLVIRDLIKSAQPKR